MNVREGRTYIKKYLDDPKNVYELTRSYRRSVANPGFVHIIVTVKKYKYLKNNKYFITMYKWDKNEDKLSRQIYENINTSTANSVSMEVRNPMQIYNLQRASNSALSVREKSSFQNDNLIRQIQKNNGIFMQLMKLLPKHYVQYNYEKNNLNDASRFCVHGSSVLHVDTTFEIIDNLWFTDTSFTNESLIDENKNHPEFLGPCMVHFHKDRETYQRFAVELAAAEPFLLKVKKVGNDLDSALFKGFGNIFQISYGNKCLQHMQEKDSNKLWQLSVSQGNLKKYYAILMDVCKIRFTNLV